MAGNRFAPANGLLDDSKQMQTTSASQKEQESPLTIGWVSGDHSSLQHLADYKNLTVVSPDFATIDNHFNLLVNSDSSLTNTIQKQGKIIWARIMMSTDTKKNIHKFLANSDKTQQIIKKIHQSALINHWYGVNLDIENVSSADRVAFSQFIKNLSVELNKTSIVISIDLPPDPNGTNNNGSPFDHETIGKYCDYIIFMGYDQHWGTDPVPGPVTSLSWLKENIHEFIQTGIPSKKLIMGLPAYTRIWQQNQQGNIVRDPAEPIQYVESLVAQNRRNLSWDSTLGEYYTSYHVNNLQYKIWLPTAKSLNIYLGLISQFHLAGSAVWSLDLMKSSYWNQIFNI
jgi:spore germination protein YaaH